MRDAGPQHLNRGKVLDLSVPSGVPAHHIAGTNFIMVHLDLVDDLDGDFHAALLLDRIRFRAGDGWWAATREQLQDETRLSEYQVQKALKHLRDVGFIETKRVSPYDPTLRYRVVVCTECAETTVNVNTTITKTRKPRAVNEESTITRGAKTTVTTSSKNSKELDKNPPISPHPFDEFWKAYPRKEGKAHAAKAFTKAAGKVDAGFLVSAAVEYHQWCEAEETDKRFIPHASTWLNGERWLDERVSTKKPDRMDAHMAHIQELWENQGVDNPHKQLEG